MKFDRIVAVRNNKTIYRDGDRCVKVFVADYAKADVLHEALNQARVEEIGIHIPKVLEVTVIEGKWVIVSEFIKGKTLARLMEEDASKTEGYMNLLADIHTEIHGKGGILLNAMEDELNRGIAASELDATVRFDLHDRLKDMPKGNRICHGDLNPSNIIMSEDGTPYVLDWSHATKGNPAADAACTWLYFRKNGEKERASRYVDMFCEKSGIEKQSVQKWKPIITAAQSAKGNSRERELLLSLIKAGDCE